MNCLQCHLPIMDVGEHTAIHNLCYNAYLQSLLIVVNYVCYN